MLSSTSIALPVFQTRSIEGVCIDHAPAIEARDLNVYYGSFQAVKGIDLKIEQR